MIISVFFQYNMIYYSFNNKMCQVFARKWFDLSLTPKMVL